MTNEDVEYALSADFFTQDLYSYYLDNNIEKLYRLSADKCTECGCCSYTCPSNIPLLDYIRIGKQMVMANIRARAMKK